ncbi:hypothetical protein [Marinigracilibium pacificum]|uniref:Uncharacterized protein n=1 Tax=Marinigracilibium pacificum TaxID=2729599 RepID=A0A848IZ53_9BACT|nr:hypothetical protein [Marinigracilibium pacificum]NMM48565.1 hypothetical protein [Marinigracilibium pacificum]
MKLKSYLMKIPFHIILTFTLIFFQPSNSIIGQSNSGNGLYAERVYLSSGNEIIDRNTFYYGEIIKVHFENITGLNNKEDQMFPGMRITVLDNNNDTVFNHKDVYKDLNNGVNYKPLQLTSTLTCANPMHSDNNYTFYIHIWDKIGNGTNDFKMDFTLKPNPKIQISEELASVKEVYIYSENKSRVINSNEISLNEKIYYVIEGVNGFKEQLQTVNAGMSILVKDNNGRIILKNDDLLGDGNLPANEFKMRINASLILNGMVVKNPVIVEIIVWDKNSDANIKIHSELMIKN